MSRKNFGKKLDSLQPFDRMTSREMCGWLFATSLASFFIPSFIAQPNGLFSVPAPLPCANKQRGFFVDCYEYNAYRPQQVLPPLLNDKNMDWKLANHLASAAWEPTNATIDTLDLRKGLHIDCGPWQGSAIAALPAMMPSNSPASIETYIRGNDLVTTHPATAERPTRVQLYWRRWRELPAQISAALELIVSVQTHLLDSDPTVILESRVPAATFASVTDDYAELMVGQEHLLVLPHPKTEPSSS